MTDDLFFRQALSYWKFLHPRDESLPFQDLPASEQSKILIDAALRKENTRLRA